MIIFDALAHMPQLKLLVGLLLVFIGLLLALAVMAESSNARRERMAERYKLLASPTATDAVVVESDEAIDNQAGQQGRSRFGETLHNLLAGAGGKISLPRLLPSTLSVGGVVVVVAFRGFDIPFVAAVAAGLIAGLVAMIMAAGRQRRNHKLAFLNMLPEAIDLVVRAVYAGIPVGEALAVAGNEAEEPVRSEFKRIAANVQLGVDIKDALHEAARRIAISDFDFFVVALVVQRETGGQLTETLQGLSTILRRRKETRLKLKALTAEGRFTAKVVAALPFLAGGLMTLSQPEFLLPLFTNPTGRILLLVASGCLGLGMYIIGRMVKGEE